MIKSFRSKETEQLFHRQSVRKLPSTIQRNALKKLLILDAAESLEDLRIPPANRLEKLSGDRQSQYSIRINQQWRICFEWNQGNAYNVEIVDYH
jgi:proteic killer suppression protein